MIPHFAAAVIWGVVYTISVLVVGLVAGRPAAWGLALLTMGLAFLSHVAQMMPAPRWLGSALVGMSWAAGLVAALVLIV